MADNQGLKPIYIEQLFRSKNPGGAKMIPGFIYSYLKKVIHQDDINDFITRYGDRKGLDFSDAILEYLHVSYQVIGEANLPSPDGRYIFVSNHPLGGPDGIILISFLGTRYPELKFPVNDLLLNLKNLNNIFLPVNKHGAQAKDAVSALEDAYASDCQMIMFPAGLVSRKQQGIQSHPASTGYCPDLYRWKKFELFLQPGEFPEKNRPESQHRNALPAG